MELIVSGGIGCGIVMTVGGFFIGFISFLIYLGVMLIVLVMQRLWLISVPLLFVPCYCVVAVHSLPLLYRISVFNILQPVYPFTCLWTVALHGNNKMSGLL